MDNLKTLEKAIQRLKDMEMINRDVMDADDIGDLEATIVGLESIRRDVIASDYLAQLKAFQEHVSYVPDCESSEWEPWVNSSYTITHGDESVKIYNSPLVHEGLVDLMKAAIEDFE